MSIIRRRFSKREKLEIVNESLEEGMDLITLSERYKIHKSTLSRWRRELYSNTDLAFPGNGNKALTEEHRQIEQLKKELKESELANEILKKALGIISSPNRKNLLS